MNRFCAGILGFVLGALVGCSFANAEECISPPQAYEKVNADVRVDSKTSLVGQKLIDFKMFLSERFDDELTPEMLDSQQFDLYYSKNVHQVLHVVTFKDGCALAEGNVPLHWWIEFDKATRGKYNDRDL